MSAEQASSARLAAAVIAAIGPNDDGRAYRVSRVLGVLELLVERPTYLQAALQVLAKETELEDRP